MQQRLERLSEHLAREAEVRSLEQEIRSQVQEELTRSQREYVLREQARAIRRQLGEYESPSEQVDDLRKRIQDAKVPESVMEIAERELTRLAAQPPGAMEAGTIRTYLEWIADLPWSKTTDDTLEVAHARAILNEDHYDIEKVKERILEFIAVLKLKRDLRGPILCFVGPPGTGKASLAARSRGRSDASSRASRWAACATRPRSGATAAPTSARCPAASCRPCAGWAPTTRCSSSTRSTSWARISAAIRRRRCSRCSTPSRTPPSATTTWKCRSTCRRCSSSRRRTCSRTSRRRCATAEVIELPGYTEEDKLEIARRHLLPRQLKEHGLETRAPKLDDDALRG